MPCILRGFVAGLIIVLMAVPAWAARSASGPIGSTGIRAEFRKDGTVLVEGTDPGTAADGKFKRGDSIVGVNGKTWEGDKESAHVLGTVLTEAEAKDGVMTFDVKPKKGVKRSVRIKIPVLGAYSDTFPLNSDKSKKIVARAAEFYADKERLEKYDLWSALACLFLLSTGDDAYVPRVKAYFNQFLTPQGQVRGIRDHSWHNGYNGIACAEYYLRTGDKSVMPIIQYLCDDARDRQLYGVGWSHWGNNARPSYEGGGGMMHGAGTQELLTLVLGRMCGAEVDEKTLQGALRHWYRWVGHGAFPVSDLRYMCELRSAGRDGGTAAVMRVASHAKGDVTIYTKATDYLAKQALTSWVARSYDWEVYWHSLAGTLVRDHDPKLYQATMDHFRWRFDLGRNAAGGFEWPANSRAKNDRSGIATALAYVAPQKNLCITGAPRSKHAVPFEMPEWIWGNKADLAFLDREPNKEYSTYGQDEGIDAVCSQLPTVGREYSPESVKNLPLKVMLKNVRHWRCEIRMAAAKALQFNAQYRELEKLLRDPDPRLRRAALDGINDCNPWFTNHPVGDQALLAEKYTPAMCEAITHIMNNPDEAWFVTDGALQALAHAPVPLINKNLPRILPWTTHEDWWLRESAFLALMGLERDQKLFVKHLPVLLEMMTNEYPYKPRHTMLAEMRKVLEKSKPDSPVFSLIVDGLGRAVVDSTVHQNQGTYPRSKEGSENVLETTGVLLEHSPGSAPGVAEALVKSGRLQLFDTKTINRVLEYLFSSLETLPEKDKSRLIEVIYSSIRPELITRFEKTQDKQIDLDLLIRLTRLKNDVPGWQAIGEPGPVQRTWCYRSFDGRKKQDRDAHRKIKLLSRVTLPEDMKEWWMPGYDDSRWPVGRAPVGKGTFRAMGRAMMHIRRAGRTIPDPFTNKSQWGDGEFIAMRTQFTVAEAELKKDYYRLRILCPAGYHVYLNGHKIQTYVWFKDEPYYRDILLNPGQVTHLKRGVNTLAVYSYVRYIEDKKGKGNNVIGQVDAYIEALSKSDLDKTASGVRR